MIAIRQRGTIMDDNSSSFDKKYYAFAAFVNIMVPRQQVRYSYGRSAAGELMHYSWLCDTMHILMTDCVCVNLKLILSKYEQQCYSESKQAYKFISIIPRIGSANIKMTMFLCMTLNMCIVNFLIFYIYKVVLYMLIIKQTNLYILLAVFF